MVRADSISERSAVAIRSILLRSPGGKDVHILQGCRTVKNPEFEMRVLPGAYHAWDQEDATTRPDGGGNPRLYDYRATKESERIVLEFLGKNLNAGQ